MSTLVVNIVRENGERLLPCASVGPRLAAASVSGRMFHGKAGNEGTCYRPNFSTVHQRMNDGRHGLVWVIMLTTSSGCFSTSISSYFESSFLFHVPTFDDQRATTSYFSVTTCTSRWIHIHKSLLPKARWLQLMALKFPTISRVGSPTSGFSVAWPDAAARTFVVKCEKWRVSEERNGREHGICFNNSPYRASGCCSRHTYHVKWALRAKRHYRTRTALEMIFCFTGTHEAG